MGLRQKSAGLILFSLLSGSVAVSLGDLGISDPPSSEPAACREAFSSSVPSCSPGDFDSGCSKSCTTGMTKTLDGLALECSPLYVSTVLGSNLSFAGVKLLCAKSRSLPEKEPAASQSTSSSTQSPTTDTLRADPPVEALSPITTSYTTRNSGNTGTPVISKGPPPEVVTPQSAALTSSESSSSSPSPSPSPISTFSSSDVTSAPSATNITSATSAPSITSAASAPSAASAASISSVTSTSNAVTSSSAAQNSTSKPAHGSIKTTSLSRSTATRAPVSSTTQSANSTTALPAGAIDNEKPKRHKKSSTGPIVGGILGGVALIVLLIVMAFYFIIRPQRRRQEEEDEDYHQKTAATTKTATLTRDTMPPKDPIYSAASPYPSQPPALPPLVTKMPYRSNSNRSAVSDLVRNDSRLSMRSINRSNSFSDRYDVSPIDRYGIPMWDPYAPSDRYGPYGMPPMDDRYGPYSAAPTNVHRYDATGVAPISFMEAEWNQFRGQQPMRQNSHSKTRPNFIHYPSVIVEERESMSVTSGQGSIYELGNDGSGSKINMRRSEDNKRVSARRSEDKLGTGTPEIPRRSPLRVVNGGPEN